MIRAHFYKRESEKEQMKSGLMNQITSKKNLNVVSKNREQAEEMENLENAKKILDNDNIERSALKKKARDGALQAWNEQLKMKEK